MVPSAANKLLVVTIQQASGRKLTKPYRIFKDAWSLIIYKFTGFIELY